jgi:ammonia channel protein AmtB
VVAQVPAGAVTGLITVTADSGAVTSVKSFKVT